jgi:predicted RNA-binding Zn ribbon-like protein
MVMARKRQDAPGGLEHVRAFVNTYEIDGGEDELVSPEALVAWLAERGLCSPTSAATRNDLRRAIELREALRSVLLAHTDRSPVPASALGTLEDAARRARLRLRFDEWGAAALEPERPGAAAGLGRLLAIVNDAIAQGTWSCLKVCRDPTCAWAFYDHTRNHSGSWCTMGVCGNRSKARAYRARQSERNES